jgi:hypothetical protein
VFGIAIIGPLVIGLSMLCMAHSVYAAGTSGDSLGAFSKKAERYLRSRTENQVEEKLVDRVLSLDMDYFQAKQVVTRIPFLHTHEKMELFRLLDKESERNQAVRDVKREGRHGFIDLGQERERRMIFKRFVLPKVNTESQYRAVQELFSKKLLVMDLYSRIRELRFLDEEDLALAKRIAKGKLEAFFNQREASHYQIAQSLEIGNVDLEGFEMDLFKEKGNFGHLRYHVRNSGIYQSGDFFGEAAVELGNDSLRPHDDPQLEYLRLEWSKGDRRLVIGDIFESYSSQALNRDFRGLSYRRKLSGSKPVYISVFGGAHIKSLDNLRKPEHDLVFLHGLSFEKPYSSKRKWILGYLAMREDSPGRARGSRILSLVHEADLSEELSLDTSLSISNGDRIRGSTRPSHALDFKLTYDDRVSLSRFKWSLYDRDYFSPLGENFENMASLEFDYRKTQGWGDWTVLAHYLKDFERPSHSALRIFRPSILIHWNEFMGLNETSLDYQYLESREESADHLRLFESNTHWISVAKNFKVLQLDGRVRFRESYDKLRSSFADRENQWSLTARGYFLWMGKQLSPEIFLGEEYKRDVVGRRDIRSSRGFQVSGEFFNHSQASARYTLWENASPVAFQAQSSEILTCKLDFPLSRDWKRSMRLSYQWEDQELSSGLSHGSQREYKLSYNNAF